MPTTQAKSAEAYAERADADTLTYEIPDEVLENAAADLGARALTISFCTGLDTCPA